MVEWYKDCKGVGIFLLRLLVGGIFLYHGVPKLMNMAGTMQFFSSLGLPGFVGVLVGILEVVGGILLIIGLWTKWAAYVLAIIIAGAIILASGRNGITAGLERDVLILVSSLVIAWSAPGRIAIDA